MAFTTSVLAESAELAIQTVAADLSPSVVIYIDGNRQIFTDANGNVFPPILYSGTTYLPLRAIGGIMGKEVSWDSATKSVHLDTPDIPLSAANDSAIERQGTDTKVSVIISPNITIYIDESIQAFKDANGKAVYPVLYNGTTYLPLRAIGVIMGKAVEWDSANRCVYLGEKPKGDSSSDQTSNTSNRSFVERYTSILQELTSIRDQMNGVLDNIYIDGRTKKEIETYMLQFDNEYPKFQKLLDKVNTINTSALTADQKKAHGLVLEAIDAGISDYKMIEIGIRTYLIGAFALSDSKEAYNIHYIDLLIEQAKDAVSSTK